MTTAGQERRTVHYTGRVQGVGFRYTAQRSAQGFTVTGCVQNLPDGRVLLIAEGASAELDRFLARVYEELNRYIQKVDVRTGPPSGEFEEFGIR